MGDAADDMKDVLEERGTKALILLFANTWTESSYFSSARSELAILSERESVGELIEAED